MNARVYGFDHEHYMRSVMNCHQDASGVWFCCRCKVAKLGEGKEHYCRDCSERVKAEETQRKEQQFQQHIESVAVKTFKTFPQWDHVKTIERFESVVTHPNARRFARNYTLEKGNCLLIGPSGSGKTSAVEASLYRCLSERRKACLDDPEDTGAQELLNKLEGITWTTALELSRAQSQHRLGSNCEPELFRKAAKATLLVIDELGPEPLSAIPSIFDLIDRRYTSKRRIIVTSGLTKAVFIDRYGDALTRRLSDSNIGGALFDLHPRDGV